MAEKSDDQFSKKEIEERVQAAFRGARIAGHKQMSEIAPKRKVDRPASKQSKAKQSKAKQSKAKQSKAKKKRR